jgi:tetratricopeptide (TPR) repeat protein
MTTDSLDSLDLLLETFYRDDEHEIFNVTLAEQIVARYPADARSHAALARAHAKLDDAEAAAHHLREALQLDAEQPDALRVKAHLLEEVDHNLPEANRVLDAAIARHPNHYGCLLARGYSAAENGDAALGAALLLRAVQARPDYRRALTNLTHFCSEGGAANALFVDAMLSACLAIESRQALDGEQLYNVGTGLHQAGRFQEAIAFLDRGRAMLGDENAIQHNRALCLESLERYQEAIDEWSALLEREPEWDWPLEGRIRCNRALGRIEAAMADIARVNALEPHNRSARRSHAGILYDQKNYADAVRVLDPLLVDHPDYDMAFALRGLCHKHLQQPVQARADFQRAVAIDPSYFVAHYQLAHVALSQGHHDEALSHSEIAISLDPSDWDSRSLRAQTLSALGRENEAKQTYAAWLQMHPDDVVARDAYATYLVEHKQWQPALTLLEQAIDPMKSQPYAAWSMGECHKGLGNAAAAREWYQKAKTQYLLDNDPASAESCESSIQNLTAKKGFFSKLFG